MFKMSCIISNRLQETRGRLLRFEWTDMLLPGVIQSMVAIAATWIISKTQDRNTKKTKVPNQKRILWLPDFDLRYSL